MLEHWINKKNNFISGWFISKKTCLDLITQAEKENWHTGDRNYTDVYLRDMSDKTFATNYLNEVFKVCEMYTKLYPSSYKVTKEFNIDPNTLRVQKYLPGLGYTDLHCENNGVLETANRHLAIMTYLNSIEDGGGTEFPNQEIKLDAEQGLTVVWPTQWTHLHRGIIAPNETKYIVTGWLNFL